MYVMAISKLWELYSGDNTYVEFIQPMHAWVNGLPGTEVAIEGYEEGVVDSVKSLSHSVVGDNLLATVLVHVRPTGPIVETNEDE